VPYTNSWQDTITSANTILTKNQVIELRNNIDATLGVINTHIGSNNGTSPGVSQHAVATDTADGFMSAADKTLIDSMKKDPNLPIGAIIMWSGAHSNVPPNWHLCDGSTIFGAVTPDLRGRFVIGATSADTGTYAANTTGGEATHLSTIAEMPIHRHIDPYAEGGVPYPAVSGTTGSRGSGDTDTDQSLYYGGYEGGSGYTSGIRASAAGAIVTAHNNVPQYYALCYIMKVTNDLSYTGS